SAHLPSPRRARFPQSLARRSAPRPFLAHRFGAETLAQRLRFTVTCLHHGRRFALVHATGEKHRRSVLAD
ncbi:hypothetical protein QLQ97_14745, partial [Burkholderia pseudomallei]|uniref:hypothetical protein n=1 Tax=Burkholderia pseudomallei TaxID=28450 RepID=UPI0024A9432C